jgi:predicted NAD-dependent protein-ADP-ribosyltransferase YbiA (DUF1768 family)
MTIKLRGYHQFLNFSSHNVLWIAPTSEHLFQAIKATSHADFMYVLAAPTPSDAKKRGHEIVCRPDWEEIKFAAMVATLLLKMITHNALRAELLATGQTPIIEDRSDPVWGGRPGAQNLLGRALGRARLILRSSKRIGDRDA